MILFLTSCSLRGTYNAHVEVVHQQCLVAATDGHLQQLCALHQTSRVERQEVIVLRQLLLFDAQGVHVVLRPSAPTASVLGARAAVGGLALLLQDQILRRELLHDGVGGHPGEAGHRREVAEHYHPGSEVGVHASVGEQKFIP